MLFLRLAALLAAITNILAGTAYAQATVKVDVGYNGSIAFRDEASGSTSSIGNPAVTRIHEGDTVQFTWQGSNHNINPYDSNTHNIGIADVVVTSSTIMASSTWTASTRLSTYRCTVHPAPMTGQVYVFEVARQFTVTAPASVNAGSPFNITVSAIGQNNTADALYRGTIQFSTSDPDPAVQLPADYSFASADNGTHTFSGLVLKTLTAGATLTVTATAGGVTGQANVKVNSSPPNPPQNIRVSP